MKGGGVASGYTTPQRLNAVVIAVILFCIVLIVSIAHMTRPEYIPFQKGLISVRNRGENIALSLNHSAGDLYHYEIESTESGVYSLSLYTTAWDRLVKSEERKGDVILIQKEDEMKSLYYVSHGPVDDVLLYGENLYAGGGIMTLPSLLLVSCMKLAIVTAIIIALTILVLRKGNQTRQYLQKIILFPVLWLVSQFLITGYDAASHTVLHDLCAILLLSMALLFLFAYLSINKRKKTSPSG